MGAGVWMSSFSGTPYQFPLHIFQLKSVCELGKMKGLKFEKAVVRWEPLVHAFSNQSNYIRLVITTVTLSGDLCP